MSAGLSGAALAALPPEILRPRYDRAALQTGVVHLGIGAFHRAHQAAVFDQALAGGDLRWGVAGVSLRSPRVRDALAPQQGLYSLLVRDGERTRLRVIGAVREVLVAPEDPAAVVRLLAQPQVHLVTLTVTEKGYKLDPVSGELLRQDAEVVADLRELSAPRTAPGFIVAGLAARRRAGLPPFTVLSCDNLPHNGRRLLGAVLTLARAHDRRLARWIENEAAFPASMVDRIVPAPTAADRSLAAKRLGVEDRACIATEPFWQWVVEDRFAGPRPDFGALGVNLAADVTPWEEAKLRLLNGAHSAMAYLGGLAGIEFVHEFVALEEGAAMVEALWDESAHTLSPPASLDLQAYRAQLLARFRNSALQHRLRQIAADGSQKLPPRLLAPLAARLAAGLPAPMLSLAVAAWMHWQRGVDDRGKRFVVDDPLSAQTALRLISGSDMSERVEQLLGLERVFGPALAGDGALRRTLVQRFESIERLGTLGALRACLDTARA